MSAHGAQQMIPQPPKPLRVLLLEDNPDDERLCLLVLERSFLNICFDVTKDRKEFIDRLHAAPYDVVLSDYDLGAWNGADAFRLLREEKKDIPFILVTGALGEVKAVECVKNGMSDYILKDHLERLPVAISRVLDEKTLRDDHRLAERLLRESEEKFRTLAENIPAAIFIEQDNRCCYVNRSGEYITGYSREELLCMSLAQLIHPDSQELVIEHQAKQLEGKLSVSRYEVMVVTKPKQEVRWLDVASGTFVLNGEPAALTTALDITDRKRNEGGLKELRDTLTGAASRQRLLEIFDSEAIRTLRTNRPFSLLYLVLNGMKQINLKYGQLVANRALCRFARTMQLHCRNLDTLGRIGSDGFAFVLPETGAEGATVLGRRIASRLANETEEPRLSCLFGATEFPQDGKTIDEMLDVAGREIRLIRGVEGEAKVSATSKYPS